MKTKRIILLCCLLYIVPAIISGQSNFNTDAYRSFLQTNQNLDYQQTTALYPLPADYYSDVSVNITTEQSEFLNQIIQLYSLTQAEADLLVKNNFVVSERLSFNTFGQALHDVYGKDLPVFLTTDAVLHALHMSYDRILMDLEIALLEPNLKEILAGLYTAYPTLLAKYSGNEELQQALSDVDLYITVARSLLEESDLPCQSPYPNNITAIRAELAAEQYTELPLFSERNRRLDFSQFTVRGHYTKEFWPEGVKRTLGAYFKTMMWLGRMEFMLTPPPENPWELPWQWWEIQRMDQGALLLNELVDMSGIRPLMQENNEIITLLVGVSDNLTPDDLSELITDHSVSLSTVADSVSWAEFQTLLKSKAEYGQRILSNILIMDPYDPNPGELPVSYRLMGQRFIIDSYIFSNLVYDRIVCDSIKVWRPMPNPLDAMFALGNNNALPLLQDEIEYYKYGSNLTALRYLIDAYDPQFWEQSLYNVWLNTLRQLNPADNLATAPLFMQSTAWQQLKLNTQLASWAQLRHDNLLYAKQSYTGGSLCSYPYSYIEPYPSFYHQIAVFADKAEKYFAGFEGMDYLLYNILEYLPRLKQVAQKLETLAQKELDNEPFNVEEREFLQKMLFVEEGSGKPPFSGWYADLFYVRDDAAEGNFVIADVHTQPTDKVGNMVGRVLHVAVGKVNLGVFIANCPGKDYRPMAFVGPVMSYYQTITDDFKRMTDEEWTDLVTAGTVPTRPDWVNLYLTDRNGQARPAGRTLPGSIYSGIRPEADAVPARYELAQNIPNPLNPSTSINYSLPQAGHVTLAVYDVLGRQVQVLVNGQQTAGKYTAEWNAGNSPSGVYFYRLQTGSVDLVRKMLLVK